MKLLWRETWLDVPAYAQAPGAVLVEVETTVPVTAVAEAIGRPAGSRFAKAIRFAFLEGPRTTLRKARAKRHELQMLGDYHFVLCAGRDADRGGRLIGLSCRAPRSASLLPCHPELTEPISDDVEAAPLLAAAAAVLRPVAERLARLGSQSYLHSGIDPPAELVRAFHDAIDRRPASVASPASAPVAAPIEPPPASDRESRRAVLRLAGRRRGERREPPIALLGGGDFPRAYLLPILRAQRADLRVVADREPQVAKGSAERWGFAAASTDPLAAIDDLPSPGLVIVATHHDSHAGLAAAALERSHRVLVEKPPVVTRDDLRLLVAAMSDAPGMLEVGFNRRADPLVLAAREAIAAEGGPVRVTCTVREIPLLPTHWYFWPNQGTRVTGNLCHWIDLGTFLTPSGAVPERVAVVEAGEPDAAIAGLEKGRNLDQPVHEDRSVTVTYDDDSRIAIAASDHGDGRRGVGERIELHRGGTTAVLDDLRRLDLTRDGDVRRRRKLWRSRGNAELLLGVLVRARSGGPSPYGLRDLIATATVQIAAAELARGGGGEAAIGNEVREALQAGTR